MKITHISANNLVPVCNPIRVVLFQGIKLLKLSNLTRIGHKVNVVNCDLPIFLVKKKKNSSVNE